MSNDLSERVRRAAYGQDTDEVFIPLLTIDHPDLATPIRVSGDIVDTFSNGNTFTAFPFDLPEPPDVTDEIASTTLTIDNVDQQIMLAIRGLTSRPTASLEVVLASDPNFVEIGPIDMEIVQAEADAFQVRAELRYDDPLDDQYPANSFNPNDTPNVI